VNTAAVAYRSGAIVSPEMVHVVGDRCTKIAHSQGTGQTGRQLLTHLVLRACVKNVAYTKNVWADVHVFDRAGEVISSGTYALRYSHATDGGGDLFELDEPVHRGSGAVGGAVGVANDARGVQYRVYYEVNGQVYTDNTLHQHDVRTDEAARNDHDAGGTDPTAA
jgi:hypothetical protein